MTSNRSHASGHPAASARGGFTLVELLVAMIILTVGLLALLGTSALDTRAIMRERNIDNAAIYAARRLEILRIDACRSGTAGSEYVVRVNDPSDTVMKNVWTFSTVPNSLGNVGIRRITMTSSYFKAPTRMYGDTRGANVVNRRTDTLEAAVSCTL